MTGSDAEQYLETVLVADLKNLPLNKGMSAHTSTVTNFCTYTLFFVQFETILLFMFNI